jgi:glycosyltransferase involved in cell wall biosynthesis
MNVLFVCLGDFKAPPGARQILLLAQALQDASHQCLVLVEGDPETVELAGGNIGAVGVGAYRFKGPVLSRKTLARARDFRPDVIHCYEPRTAPLSAALQLSRHLRVPLCVRFADDDELLYREAGGEGWRGRLGRPALLAAGTLQPNRWPYKHPLHHRRMLARAAGYDAITPTLAAAVAERYGVACRGILPALPPGAPAALSPGIRERHGLDRDAPIILYTGSVFRPHFPDFELLLRAFGDVVVRHPDALLVHTGRFAERYTEAVLRDAAGRGGERLRLLGFLAQPSDLEALMAEASVLVQPGAPNDFNRLRLPAKVHDYLLAGRPTVTFAVGLGEMLVDRVHAALTRTGNSAELAEAIDWVLQDRDRAEQMAAAGRLRAVELFDPEAVVDQTLSLYVAAGAHSAATAA